MTVAASEAGSGTETATVIATATAGVMAGSTVAPRAAGPGVGVQVGASLFATDWVAGDAQRDVLGSWKNVLHMSKPSALTSVRVR